MVGMVECLRGDGRAESTARVYLAGKKPSVVLFAVESLKKPWFLKLLIRRIQRGMTLPGL